jgi:hypothetical protein
MNLVLALRVKLLFFSLLGWGDKFYTEIVPDCKSDTLQRIVKSKMCVIHSNGYNEFVDFNHKKNFRVYQ